MKKITLSKDVQKRVESFLSFYNAKSVKDVQINTKKLSDLYNSQTTKYAGCYNSPPFIISRDKDAIQAAGYAKNCKAVITIDGKNPAIKRLIKDVLAKREIAEAKRIADRTEYLAEKESIINEANSIETDDIFKAELLLIDNYKGLEKPSYCAKIFKEFLARIKYNPVLRTPELTDNVIKSDFWQVFRILKNR